MDGKTCSAHNQVECFTFSASIHSREIVKVYQIRNARCPSLLVSRAGESQHYTCFMDYGFLFSSSIFLL